MNPILYQVGETGFDSNGIGILSDAVRCDILTELNGQYELEMQYPVKGLHFSDIAMDRILLAKVDPVSELQPFRIYRITKPMKGAVTVYARHIAYDLLGITVSPFTASSCPEALQAMKSSATTDCPFEFWTDKDTSVAMKVGTPNAIWSMLGGSEGSILDVYGGEYEFDRYKVKLHNRRGTDRGVSIRYGKNLTSLEQDENCANVYTGVHPYWTNLDGELVELPEKIIHAEGTYTRTKIMPLDLSEKFDEKPAEDQLRTMAQKYMKDNDIGTPTVSWTVEFVQLEQTEEYRGKALLDRVLLGDTVSVEFAEMGVSASARAVEIRYDSLLERYKSVSLGSVRANIADTIVDQQKEINKKAAEAESYANSAAQRAVDRQTQEDIFNKLTNNGEIQGLYVQDGTLYINCELAKVINIIADSIVSGKLSSKETSDGMKSEFDLDTGVFKTQQFFPYRNIITTISGPAIIISEYNKSTDVTTQLFRIEARPDGGTPGVTINDGMYDDSERRGLSIYGAGFTDIGTNESFTTIKGSKILISSSEMDGGTTSPLRDLVREHGTSGTWTYRKWASGLAECWGYAEFTSVAITTSWGNIYSSSAMQIALPDIVNAVPDRCELCLLSASAGVLLDVAGAPTQTDSQPFYLVSGISKNVDAKVGCRITWQWK